MYPSRPAARPSQDGYTQLHDDGNGDPDKSEPRAASLRSALTPPALLSPRAALEAKCRDLELQLREERKDSEHLKAMITLMKDHEKKAFGSAWLRMNNEAQEAESAAHHIQVACHLIVGRIRSLVVCAVPPTQPESSMREEKQIDGATVSNAVAGKEAVIPPTINEEDWEKYATKSGLLFPAGPIKFKWDLFILVLILYSSISVPFRLGMSHAAEGTWWFIEVGVGLCFIADLVLTFNTAYLSGDQLVLDRAAIRNNYFGTWFLLDLVSSLPLELIDLLVEYFSRAGGDDGEGSSGLKALRALRLVRLLRLLRLLKIQRYITQLEDAFAINLSSLQLAKVIAGICYLMHLLGCAWFWLADNAPEGAQTWITQYGLIPDDADVWSKYSVSIYWALTTLTTVGYGDIVPANETERLYALMTLLIGALVFGFLLSNVSDIVKNADQNAVRIEEKLDQVKVYLRWHHVRPELAARVKRYFEFFYSRKSAMDEDEIVNLLAPTLRRSVQKHLLQKTVEKIPIFSSERSYAELKLQLAVHHALLPLLREAKESIVESLEKGALGGPSIYFVRRGTISAQGDLPDVDFFEVDGGVQDGAVVGEHALMKVGLRSPYTLRAKTRCELYALGVSDLSEITVELTELQRDEMAKIVFDVYLQRNKLRCFTMRLVHHAVQAQRTFDPEYKAAIRLQSRWLRLTTNRLSAVVLNTHNLQELLPGIYTDITAARGGDPFSGTTMSMHLSRGGSSKKDTRPLMEGKASATSSFSQILQDVSELHEKLDRVQQHILQLPTSEQVTEAVQEATRGAANAYLQQGPA